jgi:hypothetical protein
MNEGIKFAHFTSKLGQITFRIPNKYCKETETKVRPVDVSTLDVDVYSKTVR